MMTFEEKAAYYEAWNEKRQPLKISCLFLMFAKCLISFELCV